MRRHVLALLALAGCSFLAACGGSTSSMVSGGVPMSLTIGDTPPSGVAVLFFEALITGATLQPSDSSQASVSLTAPAEVEFGHLQTDTAFLNLANVPPGTYQSVTLTFGSAAMTIVNHSGAAIGSCANNSVCQLTPNFHPSMVTLSGEPLPLTIEADSVVGMKLDLNLNSSIQNDLSIVPTVTIAHITQRKDSDEEKEMEDLDEVDGVVTAVGTNQFTLFNRRTGQSLVINTDSNTVFQDFDRAGCSAEGFGCLQVGQILDVNLSESGTGTMLAKRIEFIAPAQSEALKGTITSVDSSTQFHMVVFNEEPEIGGIPEGAPVAVTISPNATFEVAAEEMGEDEGFASFGLSFSSSADLLVGQDVQIRPGTVNSTSAPITVTSDLVRLWPSQITGHVGSVTNGSFTLMPLSPLFTGATPPINTITVQTLSETNFLDFPDQDAVAVDNAISVKGLLFNTSPTPTLVTRTLREDGD